MKKIMDSPEMQARIKGHLESAHFNTDEMIGALAVTARSDFAGDLLAHTAPMLVKARELGISDQITEVHYDGKTGRLTKVKWKDSQAAQIRLTKIFEQERGPSPIRQAARDFKAAVDELIKDAADCGIKLSRKTAIAKLKPLFE